MASNKLYLERLDLVDAYKLQRSLWQGDSIAGIQDRIDIRTEDILAVQEVQRMQLGKIPPQVSIAKFFPWTMPLVPLSNARVKKIFAKVCRTLRGSEATRDLLLLPPAIHDRGMLIENAMRIFSILPEGYVNSQWSIRVYMAPAQWIADQGEGKDIVRTLLPRDMKPDVVFDPEVVAHHNDLRITMTRPDLDGSVDLAAALMAIATVAVTHCRAICLIHAKWQAPEPDDD